MKNFKNYFSGLKKWSIPLGLFAFCLVVVLMFIYSIANNLWLKYPLFLRVPLAFEKLSLSVFREPLCHEDCALSRMLSRGVLIAALKEGNQSLKYKIVKTLKDPKEETAFKIELLRSWREAFGDEVVAPELLAIFSSSQDFELRKFFQQNFNLPLSSWKEAERLNALSQNLTIDQRAKSLALLANWDPEFLSWSKEQDILGQKNLLTPFLEASLIAANHQEFSADFFEIIWSKLIIGTEKERNLAIFLARDQLTRGKPDAEKFLLAVFDSEAFSVFSRSFAGEIINQQAGKKILLLPEIEAVSWEEYLKGENL